MKNQPTDLLDQFEEREIIYATFWERFLALLIDGLVFIPLGLVKLFIESNFGLQLFALVTAVAGLVYKPLMEYKYGATLGKMALKIEVVNKQYLSPSLSNALLRNVFEIVRDLISLIFLVLTLTGLSLYNPSRYDAFRVSVMDWHFLAGLPLYHS